MHLQSSEEKSNCEKVITIPPFTRSNISNESFLHDGTGSLELHQVPEVAVQPTHVKMEAASSSARMC